MQSTSTLSDPIVLTISELKLVTTAVREQYCPDRLHDQWPETATSVLEKLEAEIKKFDLKRQKRQEFVESLTEDELELIQTTRANYGRKTK
jgi:uncharacterized protein (DUF2344 family)